MTKNNAVSIGFVLYQVKNRSVRHARESGHPVISAADWIPAFAGMTASENHEDENLPGMGITLDPAVRHDHDRQFNFIRMGDLCV